LELGAIYELRKSIATGLPEHTSALLMIRDLISRYKRLVEIEADKKIVSLPTVDIYTELTREWFGITDPSRDQVSFVMEQLRKELDKQALFQAMHDKFNTHS
jgi:hypothetical protein